MSAEALAISPAAAARRHTTVIAGLVTRRTVTGALLCGLVFGIAVGSSIIGFAGAAGPTEASRARFAQSMAGNTAILGQAWRLDSVGGYTAWRSIGILSLVGAVWGLLTATRLLRGEEQSGRWELVLAGPTTRRQATMAAIRGLAASWLALFAVTAAVVVLGSHRAHPAFALSSSLFLALAISASPAVFLAIGLVTSQLAPTRRQAAALAAGIFGLLDLLRLIADSGSRARWLVWFTPLGWIEHLRPLTGSRPLLLLPLALLTAGLTAAAVWLAGLRDTGTGMLRDRTVAAPRLGLLGGPTGLAVRLLRPVSLGWVTGIAALSLIFGLIARGDASTISGSGMQTTINRLAGGGTGTRSYLALLFLVSSTLLALAAAGQVGATREEEADGRLDNLLVRHVSRARWLMGRLACSAAALAACGLAAGVFTWIGAASQHSGIGFTSLLLAGLNTVPVALCVLGVGTLAHALLPRWAGLVAYGLVAWSFLVEFVGSVIDANHWLLDTSLLHHLAPSPVVHPDWSRVTVLIGIGAVAAVAGVAVLNRRDVVSA